jgi:hypothetical protein
MSKVSLRRLLSKLTAIALSTTAVGSAAADAVIDATDALLTPTAPDAGDAIDSDADLDPSLTIDREHLDPCDAAFTLGRSLALALGELRPLSATHLAASWALSSDSLRRLAVGHALEWRFALVGDALVIDHLSRDDDPAIRAASARAAWARRAVGGDPGVLARLSDDPDPVVRAIAAAGG